MHYLVHWAGYDSEDDTWEPLANLSTSAMRMVHDFNAIRKAAARAQVNPALYSSNEMWRTGGDGQASPAA